MSKSTPKAPDYAGAAAEQAQSSREVTEQQTWANRADQFTPWGSQTWQNQQVWDPSTQQYLNRWAQTTNLDPALDQANQAQMDTNLQRSNLANSLTGRMQNEFGQAMDWNQFTPMGDAIQSPDQVDAGGIQGSVDPQQMQRDLQGEQLQRGLQGEDLQRGLQGEQMQRGYDIQGPELDPSQRYYQQANDAIYNQWADRALPQQAKDTDRLRTQLYNMGLKEGDAAYNDEVERQRQTQGDAQRQAQYQATMGAGQEAQRMLGMDASTRQQLTGEQAALAGFGNQAAMNQFGIGAQQGQFANEAAMNQFGMGERQGQFGNQAALGQFGIGQQQGQFANQAGQQQFGMDLNAAQYGNQAQQQNYNQMSQQQQQQYNNMLQSSQYQNQLRQQQIAEAQQARGQSLNEMNALLSGQQVSMPNMPSYNTAQRSEGLQSLQAAQLTGQAELDRYNAQQQATQGMMSGIGSMAGAGMMMSDRRFKTDVKRVGATAGGTPLYSFRYVFGGPSMVGVMADEVPHAVTKIAGINFVDYAKVT
jgi:hypothetical protein